MGAGIIPALQTPIPGVNPHIEGKGLALMYEELDEIAEELGVPAITELGDAYTEEDGETPWYDASKGLLTIAALITYIETNPEAIDERDWILADLKETEEILKAAEEHGVKFCFTMVM